MEGMLAVSESRATQVPAPSLAPTTDLYSGVSNVLLSLECFGAVTNNDREVPFQVDKAFGYSGPELVGSEDDSATNMSLSLLVTLRPPFANFRLFQQDARNSNLVS